MFVVFADRNYSKLYHDRISSEWMASIGKRRSWVFSLDETISLKILERPLWNVQLRFLSVTQKLRLLKLSTDSEAAKEAFPKCLRYPPQSPFRNCTVFYRTGCKLSPLQMVKRDDEKNYIGKKTSDIVIEILDRFYPANIKYLSYTKKKKLDFWNSLFSNSP